MADITVELTSDQAILIMDCLAIFDDAKPGFQHPIAKCSVDDAWQAMVKGWNVAAKEGCNEYLASTRRG